MNSSLCESCLHKRDVVSGTASPFLLCQKSQSDRRFPKYPPQPVVRCDGYVQSKEEENCGHEESEKAIKRLENLTCVIPLPEPDAR